MALHDFGFTNQVADSGVTFEHRSVDDALKNWKTVHYDHGSAVAVADVDGDGFPDLYVLNMQGDDHFCENVGGRRFFDAEFVLGVEPRAGGRTDKRMFFLDCDGENATSALCPQFGPKAIIRGTLSSRSSVIFDLDDDGDLDIVTNEMNDRPMLLISNLSTRKAIHFLRVKLVGATSNRDGLGAIVRVRAGDKTYTQCHDGKSGYLAQSAMPLYFGLGENDIASSVEIVWPSGEKQTVTAGIPRNALLIVREPVE